MLELIPGISFGRKNVLKEKKNVTLTLILQHILEVSYYLVNGLINNCSVIHMS